MIVFSKGRYRLGADCAVITNSVFSVISDVTRYFLGILISARDLGAGIQKDIIVNFEEEFSFINMYGWHGYGLFTMENVIILYLSIALDIALGESSFKMTLRF